MDGDGPVEFVHGGVLAGEAREVDGLAVTLDHVDLFPATEGLDGASGVAVFEAEGGEGTTEGVGGDIVDAGGIAETAEDGAQSLGGDGVARLGATDGNVEMSAARPGDGGADGEPADDAGGGGETDVGVGLVAAFADHTKAAGGEVEIGEGEVHQLGAADAGVDQSGDDGGVTEGTGVAHGVAEGEEGGDVVPGEGALLAEGDTGVTEGLAEIGGEIVFELAPVEVGVRGDHGDAYGGRCVGVEEVGGVVPELRTGDLVELDDSERGEMPGEAVEVPAVLDDGRGGSALLTFGSQELVDGVSDRCHVVLLVVVSADAAREG